MTTQPPSSASDALQKARELMEEQARAKCSKCNGDGFTAEHNPADPHPEGQCSGGCPIQVQCNDCYATGYAVIEHFPSICTELEKVTAERDAMKKENDRIFEHWHDTGRLVEFGQVTRTGTLKKELKKLKAERDAALKGYREMRDFILHIPCDCEIECRTCETGRNLLTSFPEIK